MYDTRICSRRWLALAASAVAFAFTAARPVAAQIPIVVQGTDYFHTIQPTIDSLPGIGPVTFVGKPFGPGNTDTIVQRQADANLVNGSATIPIQITRLSLMSAAPVNVGGSFFDIFVNLDPHPTGTHDMGVMTIHGNATGGTWDSTLDVFFDAHFVPTGGGPSFVVPGLDLLLNSTGATWGPTPPPGAAIVPGVDSEQGDLQDQAANMHGRLINNADIHEVDFWPGPVHLGPHGVRTSDSIPEPSTIAFGVIGLLTGGCFARRRARRA